MEQYNARYDEKTGRPIDHSYFECGLPPYLKESISNMQKSWAIEDAGGQDLHWDVAWCELNSNINSAEVDQVISAEQAWYLRRKYLRMEKE